MTREERSRSPGENRLLALAYLKKHGPSTCSNLGDYLYNRYHKKPQSFARPAGKLLQRLKRDGLVRCHFDGDHFLWSLTR